MTEQVTLTQRVLDQALELTVNHRPILVDIATRLEAFAPQIIEAWKKVYRDANLSDPLSPEDAIQATVTAEFNLFFGKLKSTSLQKYFLAFEAWSAQIARSGLSYDRVITLLREYQRCGTPFLMRAYAAGPELEAAFQSLDQLYNAMALVIAATYIQSAQGQSIYGARSRTLGQLATSASHALYSTLATIVGHAQLLSERIRDSDQLDELEEIRHSGTIGAEMARRLEEFARSGEGEAVVNSDVNLLMAQAAEMTRFATRERGEVQGVVFDLVNDFADMPPVSVRPSELRTVFVELLTNAVEAMPQGGTINMRTERKGDQVLASVLDKGTGMDEETRNRVFDPFFTTKPEPHPGLGLTTAKEIVNRYGGALTCETAKDHGSTFTVVLPVAAEMTREPIQPAKPERALNILFVDDDPGEQHMVRKFLMQHGYHADAAADGTEAVALVRRTKYDLVFVDLGMPGMSGLQVIEAITKIQPRILAILMSAWSIKLNQDKLKASGVHRVFQKPLALDQVLEIVKEGAQLSDKL